MMIHIHEKEKNKRLRTPTTITHVSSETGCLISNPISLYFFSFISRPLVIYRVMGDLRLSLSLAPPRPNDKKAP